MLVIWQTYVINFWLQSHVDAPSLADHSHRDRRACFATLPRSLHISAPDRSQTPVDICLTLSHEMGYHMQDNALSTSSERMYRLLHSMQMQCTKLHLRILHPLVLTFIYAGSFHGYLTAVRLRVR